jgi:restriction endonuclease Mrr
VGTPDANILEQLAGKSPTEFEAAVVGLFREIEEVRHNITRTRPTQDGGFDFLGTFTFPPPLRYEIQFLGEAKKFGLTTAVSPRHVSRLVARLNRGQYGIFVTTSYFTKQAQEEVFADAYPTTLIAGADVVRMMRELRIAKGGEISPTWLQAVEDEALRPLRD